MARERRHSKVSLGAAKIHEGGRREGADQAQAFGQRVEGIHIVGQGIVGAGQAQVQVSEGGQVLER